MFGRRPLRAGWDPPGLGGGDVPRDLVVLLATLFVTFSLQFFSSTAWLPAVLRLSPAIWQRGWLWQIATYPLVGYGAPGIWFLLELLILFWFARDVHRRMGQRSFRLLLLWGVLGAGLAAVATQAVATVLPGALGPAPFVLMQGQRTLLVIVIAAFATLFGNATVYLFFVLPVQAKWFLWIEILFAFMGFLGTRDLAGFVGLCVAVAVTYNLLSRGALLRGLREMRLRLEHRRIQRKLARMRKRSRMRIVKGEDSPSDGPGDRWVH